MFRIGFDPMLEAQQRQEELIREIAYIRQAEEAMIRDKPKTHNSFKLLAQVGRRMASLGSILEARYGDQFETKVGLSQQDVSSDC
jgi:hypothetical protein